MNIDQSISTEGSIIGDNYQLYNRCDVLNSILGNSCMIGEQSRIRSSILENLVKIDRNNLVYHSKIGKCSYTGPFDMVFKAEIGKYCSISYGCSIGPAEHDYRRITTHPFLYDSFYNILPKEILLDETLFEKELIIGHDVWIGCNSTILRNIKIGSGAIIGANSLVNKDIPPYAIVAGVPAKVIKYRFEPHIIQKLLDLSWWNWSDEKIQQNTCFFTAKNIDNALSEII